MKKSSVLILTVCLSTALGCASLDDTLKRVVVTGNEAQDALAQAYTAAKTETVAAGKACGARARNAVPPVSLVAIVDVSTAELARTQCAALGVSIPYDPVKLNALVGPLNAAHEAVLGVDAARKSALNGGTANYTSEIALAVTALRQFYAAAKDLGINVQSPLLDAFLGAAAGASK